MATHIAFYFLVKNIDSRGPIGYTLLVPFSWHLHTCMISKRSDMIIFFTPQKIEPFETNSRPNRIPKGYLNLSHAQKKLHYCNCYCNHSSKKSMIERVFLYEHFTLSSLRWILLCCCCCSLRWKKWFVRISEKKIAQTDFPEKMYFKTISNENFQQTWEKLIICL